MPSSRHVRMTRTAISPRFAMRTLLNTAPQWSGDKSPYPTAVLEGVSAGGGRSDGRWLVRRFAEVDSTNRYALDAARAGEPAGLVVVADHQTAGRGRLDRSWVAPPGSSLLVSVLLRPRGVVGDAYRAVMASSVALVDAITEIAGFAPQLKWPNDVTAAREHKLAGILAEQADDALVVGIGCNVNWDSVGFEAVADVGLMPATACNVEAGHPVDRDELLDAFLDALSIRLDAGETIVSEYRARLDTLGRRVRVQRPDGNLLGDAVDVDDDGALIVRDDQGRDHRIVAADVVHMRSERPRAG